MRKVKFYSKETLREVANICKLLEDSNVYTARTLSENIANVFKELGYKVTNDGYYFVIERETEEIEDIGYYF